LIIKLELASLVLVGRPAPLVLVGRPAPLVLVGRPAPLLWNSDSAITTFE